MFSKDIDIKYDVLLKNKIPLLIYDKSWLKLFGNTEDKTIIALKKDLESLLKQQRQVDRDLKSKKVQKKKIMAKILELSDMINNDSSVKVTSDSVQYLQEYQSEIHIVNEEIENLTFESEILPNEIRKANHALLKATVKSAYKVLKNDQKNLESVSEEIENYKEKLRNSIESKGNYEERISTTYTFLHNILGREEIEKLDRSMLDE